MRKHVTEQYMGLLNGEPNWCNASGKTVKEAVKDGNVHRDYSFYKRNYTN